MTEVTVDELLSIGTSQETSANTIIQQGGLTFKAPTRPNPPRQINVLSQAQLEAEFGTNIEIPPSTGIAIVVDDAFSLTKSIKVGLSSTLNMLASTPDNTVTSTASVFYENVNIVNDIQSVNLINLLLSGDTTNSVFNLVGSPTSLVRFNDVIFANFDSMGTLDTGAVIINSSAIQGFTKGLIINEPVDIIINTFGVVQFAPLGITALSIIAGITPVVASISNVRGLSFFAGDSLLFLDPNSPAGSRYTVERCSIVAGDTYQQGVDIAITSVADNGSGKARFTTVSPHNLIVGRPTVLSGFATETTYNRTVIVTAVDTPLTGTTFDVEDIDFTATDTGNVNNASLDQRSPLVTARDNVPSPDSQSHAEARTGATLEVDGSGGGDEPVVDITPAPGDWIEDPDTEEFSIDTSTGLITYNGIKDRTFLVEYQLTAVPSSGGAQVIDFDIHINGIQQTKSSIQIDTAVANVGAYIGGLFVLSPGDTLQLFKNNTTNTNNTNISVSTVLVTLS